MRFSMFLCLVFAGVSAAYGQGVPQRVPGGQLVFVPDEAQSASIAPLPDPMGQVPEVLAPPPAVYSQPQIVAPPPHGHPNGCECRVCQQRVLSRARQIIKKSKTVEEITVIDKTVIEKIHPTTTYAEPVYVAPPVMAPPPIPCPRPCPPAYAPPPRNPCPPPCPPFGMRPQQQMFGGRPPMQSGSGGCCAQVNLFGLVRVSVSKPGYGGQYAGGPPPPWAQSGYAYNGGYPWGR